MGRIKYIGVNKEVAWQGTIFKRGIWSEYNSSMINIPFDFEIEGKTKKVFEFNELSKINGIGEETIDDIKKIFNSVEQLKDALKKDKCPLRNDICVKLIKYLKVNKLW